MTFSPLPQDPSALLIHLDNDGLVAHIVAAIALLRTRGVVVNPSLVDEINEALLEQLGRTPGGLDHIRVEGAA